MQALSVSTGFQNYTDELEYTEAALKAEPITADLLPLFSARIQEAWTLEGKRRTQRTTLLQLEAAIARHNVRLSRAIKTFAAAALASVGGNRKNSTFQNYFGGVSPSIFVAVSRTEQAEKTLTLLVPQLQALPEDHHLRTYIESLRTHASGLKDALQAKEAAEQAATLHSISIKTWKENINRLRREAHAKLTLLASEHDFDKAWVESFFKPIDRKSASTEPQTVPAPQDTPA